MNFITRIVRAFLISIVALVALLSQQFPPTSSGGTWGSITGTLSNQSDLQAALNAKASSSASMTIYGTSCALGSSCSPNPPRVFGGTFVNGGNPVAINAVAYFPLPEGCTISGYRIFAVPNDTATVKFWKIAGGTAMPTVANVINTSGVSLASGGAIQSSTVTDFTTTTVTANDIGAVTITAVGGTATSVFAGLLCQ